MGTLDATFLVDYLDGADATEEFYETSEAERRVMPVPTYAEALVGEEALPDGDVDGARADLAWGETYGVDGRTAVTAGNIADEIGPGGPYFDGPDALIAAVGRKLGAPVVATDVDLTHEKMKNVVDIEEYRD